MGMTNEQILQFVEVYGEQRVIWDPDHIDYKNRSAVYEAWQKIQSSLDFDCTVSELKKKKESLMASYRLLNRKKRANPNYQISWFAYKAMDAFLSGRCNKYNDDSADQKPGLNDSTSTNQLENEFFDSNDYKHEENPDPISCYENLPEVHNTFRNRRVFKTKLKTSRQKQINEPSRNSKSTTEDNQDFDECDLYATLLAKKLRKLNEYQRDLAMHEIDNIMFRAKMKGATQNTSYSTSPSHNSAKLKSPIIIVTHQDHAYEDNNISYQHHSDIVEEQPVNND